jgi:hypothetical protein
MLTSFHEAGVVGGDEEDEWGNENGGVEIVTRFVGLNERIKSIAISYYHKHQQ